MAKLAAQGNQKALQKDEILFGPIPDDLRQSFGISVNGTFAPGPTPPTKKPAVVIWGTGKARREFLHVDDLADAIVFLMNRYEDSDHINVGTGSDLTIKELAETVKDVVFPEAILVFDQTKPDGTPQKLLDLSRLSNLGWQPRITFSEGIQETYKWYLSHTI